jgi:HD domain
MGTGGANTGKPIQGQQAMHGTDNSRFQTRRSFCAAALSLSALPWALRTRAAVLVSDLPKEVAGIAIPQSPAALRAAALSQQSCPDFLFNHCMRTFLIGALAIRKQKLQYNAEEAFVAAALHDLGLLPAFESKTQSFEIDGANAAEKFARDNGLNAVEADVVWHGVAFHDVRFSITRRAGPEAMLVALGAGGDVDGTDFSTDDEKRQLAEVLAAFPRLQFKKRFTTLVIDHCKRKPTSQRGTWLEGLCREQMPAAWNDSGEQEIMGAPYAE